jgi:hypothetical protein
MKRSFSLVLIVLLLLLTALLIIAAPSLVAAKTIQQAQSRVTPEQPEQIVVPAGTQVDVEAAYTVSSLDVQSGDLISFRVLVPIKINGVAVIDKGALVTARVLEAKRGGHWGKAGRLSWTMQDVIAVDSTRVPLQSGAEAGSDEINNVGSLRGQPAWGAGNPKKNAKQSARTRNSVKGVSHGGEIAAKIIIAGALFPPLAPLGLIQGFRRGENAVLPEGKRFLAFGQSDTNVNAARDRVPD